MTDRLPLEGMRVNGRFSLPKGVEIPRLQDRDQLRRELDAFRAQVDVSPGFRQQDRYTQEAFDLVLGGAAQKAFDLSQESDELRDRYGRKQAGQRLLLARRLVESGARFVTLTYGGWDMHNDITSNFNR